MAAEPLHIEQPTNAESQDAAGRNRSLIHAFWEEAFGCEGAQRAERLPAFAASGKIAPDVVVHDPFMGRVSGVGVFAQLHLLFESAFCCERVTVHDINAAGDLVCVFYTYSGQHTGRYIGLPATGKSVSLPCMELYRLCDGKIVEVWRQDVGAALLVQLGVVPTGYQMAR